MIKEFFIGQRVQMTQEGVNRFYPVRKHRTVCGTVTAVKSEKNFVYVKADCDKSDFLWHTCWWTSLAAEGCPKEEGKGAGKG